MGETLRPPVDRARWELTAQQPPPWDERNRVLASFVPPGSSVVDLGSGAQTLRDYLPAGCSYQPVDLIPGPRVIVCDFEAGEFPSLDEPADIAVCSGVLEYLHEPGLFVARLPSLARQALLSYAVRSRGQPETERMARGWINHFSRAQLLALVRQAGLTPHELTNWRGQLILAARPRGTRVPPLRQPRTPGA